MTKVPPPKSPAPSSPRARPPRASERPRAPKSAQQASPAEADESPALDGGRPEASHEELTREAERRGEMWKPDSQSDRDEKLSRDEAHAEGEAAEAREQAELNPKLAGARTSRRGDPFADSKSTPLNDAFDAKLEVLERMSAALDPSAPKAQGPGPNAGARPPDAMAVLHAAQEPGILFRHEPAPQDGGEEDLEFAAAVAEAAQALAPVPGVLRVRAGRNDAGEKIVLIVVSKGFGEASMRRVPGRFRQFPSLLAVPYELLPLRRSR